MEGEVDAGLMATLVSMGFEQEAAANALLITNNASLDEALDYLQRYCLPAGAGAEGGAPPAHDKKDVVDVQVPVLPLPLLI
jgi:uncharacterized UBP type Zn finger protein